MNQKTWRTKYKKALLLRRRGLELQRKARKQLAELEDVLLGSNNH